ncbi:hypothetical protein HQ576_15895, partial [bacterium]|nr:hypothetical protein [bacterium]
MAKGHQKVVRRSLTDAEWLQLRFRDVHRWRELAAHPTEDWQVRDAEYPAPGVVQPVGCWRRIQDGEMFGGPDATVLFRGTAEVPQAFAGQPVLFSLATPTEMLVRVDGTLVNGIDPNRSEMPLVRHAQGGERFAIDLECYVRSAPDDTRVKSGPGWGCVQPWQTPRLVVLDRVVEQFVYDFEVPLDAALCPQVDDDVRDYLLHHLDEAMKLIDRDTADRDAYHASLAAARKHLWQRVYRARSLGGQGRLALVGHSHVDVAYHWRTRQGVRKNARTTAVQLALMDEYPEFRYCHTQPYVYEQLKEHWPELFERVKEKVKTGQWELVGGMYVEPDCNVPSGESLIRQCLLGQLFYQREFGRIVDTCWLPDV